MPDTPTNPYAEFLARSRFASLDGVRAISILAVLWHHATPGIQGWPITHNGFLGVDMFFVLSGFLIVTLLLRERDGRGRISLSAFYLRRTLRIFPVYYGLLTLLLARYLLSPGNPDAPPFYHALPWYLTYTSNWIPDHMHGAGLAITWSLATEEQFYLVWPFLERYLPRRAVVMALVTMLGVNQCINFGIADPWFGGWIGTHRPELPILQATFTPILLGVGLAHLLHSPRIFGTAFRILGRRWMPLVTASAIIIACNYHGDLAGWPRLTIQLLMTAFLASCVVREDHAARPLLASTPMQSIGMVSYGMYLFHIFLITLSTRLASRLGLESPVTAFLACTLVTYAVAQVSFRLYERPFLRLKGRFERRDLHPKAVAGRMG
jgi:peptidoglycan/LPS O-acetylase OafA/YrhL